MTLVERTASWRDDCLGRICGLANAQGGVLEVGRDDRGAVVDVKDPGRLAKEIGREVESQMGIAVDVRLKRKDGAQYVRIVVGPSPSPVSFKGEFHYRSPSTAQVLRGSALERFLARRRRELPKRGAAQEADAPAQETAGVAQERPETTQETVNTTQEPLETTQEPTPTTQETTPQSPPTTTRERVLALLKADPRTTRRRMAEQIGITPDGVKYHLAKLRKAGIIRHVGPTKAGRWKVLK